MLSRLALSVVVILVAIVALLLVGSIVSDLVRTVTAGLAAAGG